MEWRSVEGYEGLYLVSETGVIKSEDRVVKHSRGGNKRLKSKTLTHKVDKYGYAEVSLSKDGKRTSCKVHRLVAQAFVDNPNEDNNTHINHKDEDKLNNHKDNLEWCTPSYNNSYGTRVSRVSNKKSGGVNKRAVISINIKTGESKLYSSMSLLKEEGFDPRGIWKCCNGFSKTYKGFYWEYYKEENNEGN
ncbi:HNH nuclease like protein [Bacillus phage vB_BthM-Goe5]|nr:HNH nuclease like protein [Bacillus phage vB_BthM-Goe5]